MKPNESFIGQPVRSLQTMLRTISQVYPNQKTVVPDGIYSKQTEAAVSSFQRRKGIPVTGIVNNATWDKIVTEYELCLVETAPAQSLQISLNPGQVLTLGSENVQIPLIQTMLFVLSQAYDSIPEPEISGVLDAETQKSLMAFQIFSNLKPTGNLDKRTWKNLALQYSQITDRIENKCDQEPTASE